MNYLGVSGNAEYSKPIRSVFSSIKNTFTESSVFELVEADEAGNRVVLQTRAGLFSWGEVITIELSSSPSRGTSVRVTSRHKRAPGEWGKLVQTNQSNVDNVLSDISEGLGKRSSDKVSNSNFAKKVISPSSDGSTGPNEWGGNEKPISTGTRNAIIAGVGVVVVGLIFVSALFGTPLQSADAPQTTLPPVAASETPAPVETKTAAPKPPRTTSPAPAACFDTETAVTMVRNVFLDGTATPAQVSAILNEASRMWASDAANSSGSKKEWRLKMSELALAVDSYLTTGSPSDGETKFDQLFANMGLVNNFC
jgi:hypothetical protein